MLKKDKLRISRCDGCGDVILVVADVSRTISGR